MENILAILSIFNLTSEIAVHLELIEVSISKYLSDAQNVAVITDHIADWRDVKFSVPVQFMPLKEPEKISSHSYIFDIRTEYTIAKSIKLIRRNSETKYVIVVSEEHHLAILQQVNEIGLCHVLVINIQAENISAEIVTNPCKGIGKSPTKVCQFNVSALTVPPASFFLTESEVSGFEAILFKSVAEYLNLNVTFINGYENVGAADPPTGVLGDVVLGKSIAAMGGFYSFASRFQFLDLHQSCYETRLTWAVPSHAGKQHPTWFVILVTEFSPIVWLFLLITLLSLVVYSMLAKWEEKKASFWIFYAIALLLGVPQRERVCRIVIIASTFLGFVITSHYQTVMSSKLTVPAKIPEITSGKDLLESNLELLGLPSIKVILSDVINGNPGDQITTEILKRYKVQAVTTMDALVKIATDRNLAYSRTGENLEYLAQQVRKCLKLI